MDPDNVKNAEPKVEEPEAKPVEGDEPEKKLTKAEKNKLRKQR
jgi:hypothetical protein